MVSNIRNASRNALQTTSQWQATHRSLLCHSHSNDALLEIYASNHFLNNLLCGGKFSHDCHAENRWIKMKWKNKYLVERQEWSVRTFSSAQSRTSMWIMRQNWLTPRISMLRIHSIFLHQIGPSFIYLPLKCVCLLLFFLVFHISKSYFRGLTTETRTSQ